MNTGLRSIQNPKEMQGALSSRYRSPDKHLTPTTPRQVRGFLLPWSPRQDVRHQISVDPADHPGIHLGDLEEVVDARITGSANAEIWLALDQSCC